MLQERYTSYWGRYTRFHTNLFPIPLNVSFIEVLKYIIDILGFDLINYGVIKKNLGTFHIIIPWIYLVYRSLCWVFQSIYLAYRKHMALEHHYWLLGISEICDFGTSQACHTGKLHLISTVIGHERERKSQCVSLSNTFFNVMLCNRLTY